MPYCERCKNPAKFAKKLRKTTVYPIGLPNSSKQDWGEYYAELGQALRQPAPIFLRVNRKFCSVEDYADILTQQGIGFALVSIGFEKVQTIQLTDAIRITDLPKFAEGWVSVQDKHAQLSAHILVNLALDKSLTVLDACTAPGVNWRIYWSLMSQKRFT